MKLTIITPCKNAESYIEETVASVLGQSAVQSGRVELQYFICDGNSSDDTLQRLSRFDSNQIQIFSESDKSVYDALAKGLRHADGDIVAYINAGDYYHPRAFDIVIDIFEQRRCDWITGCSMFYSHNSYLIDFYLPFKYRRRFFECGFYYKRLHAVQQESTFWRQSLMKHIDLDRLANFSYAGDYYIWNEFSKYSELAIICAYLGGFKIHKGQLSEDKNGYAQELFSITSRPTLTDHALSLFDMAVFRLPIRIKKHLNPRGILRYDHVTSSFI